MRMESLLKQWVLRPLLEVATLQRGYDLPIQNRVSGNVPILAANSVVGTHNQSKVKAPGVVTGRSGSIGNVQYVTEDYWPLNTALYVKDFHGNHPRFIFYLLREMKLEEYLEGTGVPTLNRNNVHSVLVPVPPLPEQRRIAAILDQADALRVKRKVALAQLDNLAQSIFIEMFGDPAANPKGWSYKSLFDLGKVVTGGTPPSAKSGMFDGPIPFVTPGDLESDEPVKRSLTTEGAKESRTVRAGATLVCCIGATIGKMGIAQVQSAFNQQLNAVEWTGGVDDLYGHAVLRFFKPTIKTWGASTTLPILKKSSFEKIEIPVPPLPLQREFAEKVKATEKLRKAHKFSLSELEELFASLQNRAFKGEL